MTVHVSKQAKHGTVSVLYSFEFKAHKKQLEVICAESPSRWEGFEVLTVLSDQGDSTHILIKHPASIVSHLRVTKKEEKAVFHCAKNKNGQKV